MNYSKNQIAFSRKRPMCGMGARIEKGESIESIINKAGLNWTIDEQNATYNHNGSTHTDKTKKLLIKSDDSSLLHIGSNRFKLVQPSTIISTYFDIVNNLGFEMEVIG